MKKLASLVVLALAAFALVACGGDDDNGDETAAETPTEQAQKPAGGDEGGAAGGATETLTFDVAPDGGLAYTVKTETAKAGPTTLEVNNEQSVPHDVALEDDAGEQIAATEVVTDDTSSTEVDLKPGKYTFYCSVPGHREAGMEGTLTVE